MDTSELVFRSVYVDHDVDRTVIAHAKRLGVPSGAVFRMVLDAGLAQLSTQACLPAAKDEVSVLRTVSIRYEVAEAVRMLEYRHSTDRGTLAQRLTRLGMRFLETTPWMPYPWNRARQSQARRPST